MISLKEALIRKNRTSDIIEMMHEETVKFLRDYYNLDSSQYELVEKK